MLPAYLLLGRQVNKLLPGTLTLPPPFSPGFVEPPKLAPDPNLRETS